MVELNQALLNGFLVLQQDNSNNHKVRLWVASGDNEYMQLTWLSLLDYHDEEQMTAGQRHKSNDYSVSGVYCCVFHFSLLSNLGLLCFLDIIYQGELGGVGGGEERLWLQSVRITLAPFFSYFLSDFELHPRYLIAKHCMFFWVLSVLKPCH